VTPAHAIRFAVGQLKILANIYADETGFAQKRVLGKLGCEIKIKASIAGMHRLAVNPGAG
jgi:hypothetical protein